MDSTTPLTQSHTGSVLDSSDIRELETIVGMCNAVHHTDAKQELVDRALRQRYHAFEQALDRYCFYRTWGGATADNFRRSYLQARGSLSRLLYLAINLNFDPSNKYQIRYSLCRNLELVD